MFDAGRREAYPLYFSTFDSSRTRTPSRPFKRPVEKRSKWDNENRPPKLFDEHVADMAPFVESLKQGTRDKLGRKLGIALRAPEEGERDDIIYPPHVAFLDAVITPIARRDREHKSRLRALFGKASWSEEDLALYASMTRSPRELRIEDAAGDCPGCYNVTLGKS